MGNLLGQIHTPQDVRKLNDAELNALCEEIRKAVIETVSGNGGHLASNLGVVELTVALMLALIRPRTVLSGTSAIRAIPISF